MKISQGHRGAISRAFTLIEVMIAVAIFFSCMFAILALVSSSLRSARVLQTKEVDAGMLAAHFLALTNRLYEGPIDIPPELEELYPDCRFDGEVREYQSNRLFQVDFVVMQKRGQREVSSMISVFVYAPDSPPGSMSGAGGAMRP